jgi:hypothetical protein
MIPIWIDKGWWEQSAEENNCPYERWCNKDLIELDNKDVCAYGLFSDAFNYGVACGSTVGWGPMLQARRSLVQFPIRSLDFLIYQPQYGPGVDSASKEMSTTTNCPGGEGWLACKADNLTAIYEPIV